MATSLMKIKPICSRQMANARQRGEAKVKECPIKAEQAAEWARRYLEEGLSAPEAAKRAAREAGVKKGEVYRLLVEEGSRGGEG